MTDFKTIINDYNIQIPIIQRDYAQGRKGDQIKEIRRNFLENILNHLNQNKQLHLDFVYGSIKHSEDKKYFIPLDGQQRLTTLFLLYWYFGKKEQKEIEYLLNFTYETRSSSREFCNKLVSAHIDFTNTDLIEQIKNSSWFMPFWDNDPTIKSMFRMIDDIHKTFQNHQFYEKLHSITFEFFELKKFGLDDDLYIKMNARGKSLTIFENFKATFEQLLKTIDEKLEKEFSKKIDNEWTNIFWTYKDKKYLIDTPFMNFFYYISEMLYIKNKKVEKELTMPELKSLVPSIYSDEENVKFLFNALDQLNLANNVIENVFTGFDYKPEKVALFDANINLLDKVIKNEKGNLINLQQKILLFIIIHECAVNGENINTSNVKDAIRVVRNLSERVRSLKQSQLKYTATLKYENLHQIILSFTNIDKNIYTHLLEETVETTGTQITKKSLSQEISKAKLIRKNPSIKEDIERLEDYHYLKGDLSNFITDNVVDLNYYSIAVPKIYESRDDYVSRAMLSVGDFCLWRGWAAGNDKYFFGRKGYWEIILTSEKKEFFTKFLTQYRESNESLEEMISSFITKKSTKDWIYYFVKYEEFLNKDYSISQDHNVFAWYDDFSLEKMGGTNLNAYHFNPYLKVVAIKSNIGYQVFKWDGYSSLKIHAKVTDLHCEKCGWSIKFSESVNDTDKLNLINKFSLVEKYPNNFVLEHSDDMDIIEKVCGFIASVKEI